MGQLTTLSMAGYAYRREVAPGDEVEPIEWSMTSESANPVETISGASTDRTWVLAAALLAGALLGAAAMHYLDSRPAAPVARASGGVAGVADVRVSLGAYAGDLSTVAGDPVVSVPLVITNLGSAPLTLEAIAVSGPGASLVPDPGGRPVQVLPITLVLGRPVDTRIAIRSDCAVTVRPPPTVILVVKDSRSQVRQVDVVIPDLDTIWGQTLVGPACGLP